MGLGKGQGYMSLYSYGAPLRFYARAGAAALVHCPGLVTAAPLGIECLQSFTADSWSSGELWWLGVSRCQAGSPTLGGMSLHADLKNMIKCLNISLYSYEHT